MIYTLRFIQYIHTYFCLFFIDQEGLSADLRSSCCSYLSQHLCVRTLHRSFFQSWQRKLVLIRHWFHTNLVRPRNQYIISIYYDCAQLKYCVIDQVACAIVSCRSSLGSGWYHSFFNSHKDLRPQLFSDHLLSHEEPMTEDRCIHTRERLHTTISTTKCKPKLRTCLTNNLFDRASHRQYLEYMDRIRTNTLLGRKRDRGKLLCW